MKRRILALASALTLLLAAAACTYRGAESDGTASPSPSPGKIYLYGEYHGVEKILNKEFEIWYDYYHNENMRHLFIEYPYYTAEFLNIWMRSDDDGILEELYNDWEGTQAHNPLIKEFYRKIKSDCPETVFHGTDVGHFNGTTGRRFLKYLEDENQKDSAMYRLAQEAMEQGDYYYSRGGEAYRENKMAENFIREFDSLDGQSVMGIYGSAHTGLDAMDFSGAVPCMANQLKARYGDAVFSEDLSWMAEDITWMAKETEPLRVDTITVGGKAYKALYFGISDLTGFKNFVSREFWRLEDAYDDFKDNPKTGDVLPYDNYPMLIETGQVFVIDYTLTDGTVKRMYYRSDGLVWDGRPATEEFTVEEEKLTLNDVGVHKLDLNTEYSVDLDGDGVPDTLRLHNNNPQWSCEVLFNGDKINDGDDWQWISQAHLIRRAGNSVALIYQQDGDGNMCTTSIYTFTDGKAKKTEYRRYAYSFLTDDSLLLTTPVYYFLGNQFVSIEAAINADFTLTLGNDGWFKVITEHDSGSAEDVYRSKTEIPMLRLENGEYVEAKLPAGTRVYPQFIDEAQTRMIMKTDDGALWMYVRDSAGLHFEESDLFDGCTYAGP